MQHEHDFFDVVTAVGVVGAAHKQFPVVGESVRCRFRLQRCNVTNFQHNFDRHFDMVFLRECALLLDQPQLEITEHLLLLAQVRFFFFESFALITVLFSTMGGEQYLEKMMMMMIVAPPFGNTNVNHKKNVRTTRRSCGALRQFLMYRSSLLLLDCFCCYVKKQKQTK